MLQYVLSTNIIINKLEYNKMTIGQFYRRKCPYKQADLLLQLRHLSSALLASESKHLLQIDHPPLASIMLFHLFLIQTTNICLAPALCHSLPRCLGKYKGEDDMVMTHAQPAVLQRRPCIKHLFSKGNLPCYNALGVYLHEFICLRTLLFDCREVKKTLIHKLGGQSKIKQQKVAYLLITC